MLYCMSGSQLAIRFTDEQMATIDAIARESHTTRSAVVKGLVDAAERDRISAAYSAGYPATQRDVDAFGDVDAFHEDAETERVDARSGDESW